MITNNSIYQNTIIWDETTSDYVSAKLIKGSRLARRILNLARENPEQIIITWEADKTIEVKFPLKLLKISAPIKTRMDDEEREELLRRYKGTIL